MIDRDKVLVLGLVLVLLPGADARSQTALGDDLVIAALLPDVWLETFPQPACDDAGACGLFWIAIHDLPNVNKDDIVAAVLSPQGQIQTQPKVLATGHVIAGPMAVGMERGFAVFWEEEFSDGHVSPMLQYFDQSLMPKREAITLPLSRNIHIHDPNYYTFLMQASRTAKGFILYGYAIVDASSLSGDAFIYFIDNNGRVLRGRRRVNQGFASNPSPNSLGGGLAVQPNGNLIAVYWRGDGVKPGNVYLRRLTAAGRPLGSEMVVNADHKVINSYPVVACGPDGKFVVVWQRAPDSNTTKDILARRFSAKGIPLGAPFRVNSERLLDQRFPATAVDTQGNYFIVWQGFDPTSPDFQWDIHGRLFRHDGTTVSGEIRINQEQQFDQIVPRVAAGPDGTFTVGWQSSSPQQTGSGGPVPVIRRFADIEP